MQRWETQPCTQPQGPDSEAQSREGGREKESRLSESPGERTGGPTCSSATKPGTTGVRVSTSAYACSVERVSECMWRSLACSLAHWLSG